ncbi:MAG: hypothetical protein HY547_08770 [Elusimicrobia bacterium]|nr:hypothetical protein [Elusimicrobiota bacterium]
MDDDTRQELETIGALIQELAKRHGQAREETRHLQSLVTAMDQDHQRATKINSEFEKMTRERERLREKIAGMVEKLEELKIS